MAAPTPQRSQETQPQNSEDSASLEGEIALAIALILAGGAALPPSTTPLAAIAALLLLLPDVRGDAVADTAARLVARDAPRLSEGSGALRASHMSNLSYGAHYAINAAKRLAQDVAGGESLQGALAKESRHFADHREAERARSAGARLNDAAAERWGFILNWNHTGKAHTHRASHVGADGKNYDVRNPPRSTDGMLPGMALHCDCVPAPPKRGALMLR